MAKKKGTNKNHSAVQNSNISKVQAQTEEQNNIFNDTKILSPTASEEYEKAVRLTREKVTIRELINFDKEPLESVKVSIVVPVCNVELYLRECLDSCVNQTLKEIEIICVNDCSTDNCLDILKEYAAHDDRIKVIDFGENYTASVARKLGVHMTKGSYVMFLDGDDTLELNACEFLYENMVQEPVDILHFGTNIINSANLPNQRIDNMKKFVEPFNGVLKGKEVFEACFVTSKYNFSIWNKLYKADLVKRAFLNVEDIPLPKAQDKYAYFIISYFAESYRGIKEKFYNYNFGHGITGHNVLDLLSFEKYCKMGDTAAAINRFASSTNDPFYISAGEKSGYQLLEDCVSNWNRLTDEDASAGFDLMTEHFDKAKVISSIAKKYWWAYDIAAAKIFDSKRLKTTNKEIKTIATYYHKLECGGVQRVLVQLTELWLKMGYNVIVLTDLPPCDGDYDLPENVVRITIPSFFSITKDNYIERAEAIQRLTEEYSIDLVVYHAWVSNIMLWDMAMFKLNDVKFSIHCHSIYSMLTVNSRLSWANMPYVYTLADGVVTLSKVDYEYWKNFNNNVIQVNNPLSFDNTEDFQPSSLATNNIIWCARFSEEKHPLDAIEIFNIVHREIPTAKLFMLGAGTTSFYQNEIQKRIKKYNIENDVILCGYQKDPRIFYELSSVNLITSEYEGFLLTLYESMQHGIPSVMFEMPYLSLVQSGKGIVAIKNKSIIHAADAIIELLKNEDKRKKMGTDARALASELAEYDYQKIWREFFKATENLSAEKKNVPVLWATLFAHYKTGITRLNNKISEYDKKLNDKNRLIKISDQESMTEQELVGKLKWNRQENLKNESTIDSLLKQLDKLTEDNRLLKRRIADDECEIENAELKKKISWLREQKEHSDREAILMKAKLTDENRKIKISDGEIIGEKELVEKVIWLRKENTEQQNIINDLYKKIDWLRKQREEKLKEISVIKSSIDNQSIEIQLSDNETLSEKALIKKYKWIKEKNEELEEKIKALSLIIEEQKNGLNDIQLENQKLLEREASVKNSKSYKIGRAITWLPRKLKG